MIITVQSESYIKKYVIQINCEANKNYFENQQMTGEGWQEISTGCCFEEGIVLFIPKKNSNFMPGGWI